MFESKVKNGKANPKYVDILEEDKPIAQQKYVCVSFISPEKEIKSKEMFLFEEFVKSWDLAKSIEKYAQFTAFLSFKYNLNMETIQADLTEFCKEESAKLHETNLLDDFKNFTDKNGDKLETDYLTQNKFQTCIRGIKVRGVFPTIEEAELRAKILREVDPNFDIFVGPVGIWMPWDPEAYKTGRVEYMEEELNQLMHKKKDNEDKAKDYFNQRVKETKMKAIEENKKKAEETGNVLTQNITEDGTLVGIKDTQESLFQSIETTNEVQTKLFGENVQTSKSLEGLSPLKMP
jgi:Family of unknown function (DUF5832)